MIDFIRHHNIYKTVLSISLSASEIRTQQNLYYFSKIVTFILHTDIYIFFFFLKQDTDKVASESYIIIIQFILHFFSTMLKYKLLHLLLGLAVSLYFFMDYRFQVTFQWSNAHTRYGRF